MEFILNTAHPKMPTSGSTVTHTPASQPLQAGSAEDGGEEFCASAQADSRGEKPDAEFAESEVSIHQHVPDLVPDAAQAPER